MTASVLESINLHMKSEVPSFTHSKNMTGPQNLQMGHVNLTTHTLSGVIYHPKANTSYSLPV